MRPPTDGHMTQELLDREEKLERRRELRYDQQHAAEEASRLQLIETDVERTPTNIRDAICLIALQGLDEAILATMPGFTPQQAAAVVLIGRRMSYEDAAAALGVPVSEIYLWSRTVENWDRELVRWREQREVDMGMYLLNGIEALLLKPLDPGVLVKLLALLEKVSQHPETRDFRRMQLVLAAEKVQLARDHLNKEHGGEGGQLSSALVMQFSKFQDDNLQKLLQAQQAEDGEPEL